MALDLQQRATQHGHRRYNTRTETKNGRVILRLDPMKNGGITEHLRRTAINAHAHHYRSQRELHSTQGAGLHVNLGDCQPLKK